MATLADFFDSFEFATPLYFWIAGALVLLLIFLPWFGKKKGLAVDLQYWEKEVAFKSKRFWVLSLPVIIASILMVGVLSTPQITTRQITDIYGYPVMIVIDVSGSMGAGYAEQTSFGNAYDAFDELVARRSDINFGLLVFSTENYVARYFINKNELFQDTLENSKEISYISKGTRITEALVKAHQFLTDNITGEDKAIILISDLDVDSRELLRIVEEIKKISSASINIYIIATGAGKQKADSIPQMPRLRIMGVDDEDSIDNMCTEISAMQMSPIREEEGLSKNSLIPFLILPALVVIYICLILGETRFRKIP
jgi:hypothetical protein